MGMAALVFASFAVVYGYRWGSESVESEYEELAAAQRKNALIRAENYQAHRRATDATNVRKKVNHEIKNSDILCVATDNNLLQLYKTAGVRDDTR